MENKRLKTTTMMCMLMLNVSLYCRASEHPKEDHNPSGGKKVDFFTSMEWRHKKRKLLMKKYMPKGSSALKTMLFLKAIYDKNNFFKRPVLFEAKIPKKIHQIWLGPKTPPAVFKQSQESIKKYHPDWEYKLWTDKDIPDLYLHNQKFYDLSDNYGEKADIVRYEILYKFGGVYADVDFICFKPFDILCQWDLWASMEPMDIAGGIGINNAIIGSIASHPILDHCISTIKESWYASKNIFVRVGPKHFKKSFLTCAEKDHDNIIALPRSFFYPLDFQSGIWKLKGKTDYKLLNSALRPESFAVHLWAGTWRK